MRRLIGFCLCLLVLGCSIKDDEEPCSEICFIGDSITYLWDLEYYFPNENIIKHAVSGAIVQDFDKWDLSDCNGKKTVVLIGTNNIGKVRITDDDAAALRAYFIREYKKRIETIRPDPLIAVSILPRNSSYRQDTTVNMNIQALNKEIVELLGSMDINYEYVDVFDLFLDKGYEIRRDYFKDGLHPNESGYEILAREIGKKL